MPKKKGCCGPRKGRSAAPNLSRPKGGARRSPAPNRRSNPRRGK